MNWFIFKRNKQISLNEAWGWGVKYLRITTTNQNRTHEDIKSKLIGGILAIAYFRNSPHVKKN
jgi:hypothetical protein